MADFAPGLAFYLVAIALVAWMHWREHDPDKRERFRRLPLRFKCACVLVVCPLASLMPWTLYALDYGILGGLPGAVGAPVALLVLEIRGMEWYRRVGLL